MESVTYFFFEGCPYCKEADRWIDSLLSQRPEYRKIGLTRIDERKHPEIADKYDYYYVPTFYVGAEKVHEGAATRDKVEAVFMKAAGGAGEAVG